MSDPSLITPTNPAGLETAHIRGSLYVDRSCVYGGDLIVVTGNEQNGKPDNDNVGRVWRVNSSGTATLVKDLGRHLEGVVTLADNPSKYGPLLAGRILVGDEDILVQGNTAVYGTGGRIWALRPGASDPIVTIGAAFPPYPNLSTGAVQLHPEDLDLIPQPRPGLPGDGDLFAIDFGGEQVLRAPASDFADKCGDILVTQELPNGSNPALPSGFSTLRWDGFQVVVTPLTNTGVPVGHFEHVTFRGGQDCVPNVSIVKFTNGADANDPNAAGVPNIVIGGAVTWTYLVTNTGHTDVPRNQVVVTDNVSGVTPTFTSEISGNGDTIFEPGEVWLYTATGTALNLTLPPPPGTHLVPNSCTAGGTQPPRTAYTNIGTVTIPGATANDPSSYCNPPAPPQVAIKKYTNGNDADDPDAAGVPLIAPNGAITWRYDVTNPGTVAVPRAQITVTDNQPGVTPQPVLNGAFVSGDANANNLLDPGETWVYQATGNAVNLLLPPVGVIVTPNVCREGIASNPGRTAYTNIGTVTIPGATANDPSSYCNPPPVPGVTIIKFTNGADANDPNAAGVPNITPGGVVTWTYRVTNTGQTSVVRANVDVTDNTTGVTPTFTSVITGNPDAIFDPGEVWLYTATGTALNLALPPPDGVHTVANSCTAGGTQPPRTAYTNIGTVTIPGASATDPSSYCNTPPTSICIDGRIGGIDLGDLPQKYLFLFANGSEDANWQGATKGFVGNVLVDGILARERTSGGVAYAGTISTSDSTLGAWQSIVDKNPGQAFASLGQTQLISDEKAKLIAAFAQINALPVTPGYESRSAESLDGLDTTNNVAETFVINVTSGFHISRPIDITGDPGDVYILRWDTDADFSNGYQGQVKFQGGGAIIPHGGLTAANFIHVAGDINSSGGGGNPPAPYPQGPRLNNGKGPLGNGAKDFSGGGFFTGYWLTTGDPDSGHTAPQSNGIFVGGWYTLTDKFSMTSGTSGVQVCPTEPASIR